MSNFRWEWKVESLGEYFRSIRSVKDVIFWIWGRGIILLLLFWCIRFYQIKLLRRGWIFVSIAIEATSKLAPLQHHTSKIRILFWHVHSNNISVHHYGDISAFKLTKYEHFRDLKLNKLEWLKEKPEKRQIFNEILFFISLEITYKNSKNVHMLRFKKTQFFENDNKLWWFRVVAYLKNRSHSLLLIQQIELNQNRFPDQ